MASEELNNLLQDIEDEIKEEQEYIAENQPSPPPPAGGADNNNDKPPPLQPFLPTTPKSIHELTDDECRKAGQCNDEDDEAVNAAVSLTQRLKILEAWKILIQELVSTDVFGEYVANMNRAYDGFLDGNLPEPHYQHVETLLKLLHHTVENSHRDGSTECRYVTLLEVLLSYLPDWSPSDEVSRLWIRVMQRIPYEINGVQFRQRAYRVLVSLAWVPSTKGLLAACSLEQRKVHPVVLPAAAQTFRSNHLIAATNTAHRYQEPSVWVPRHDAVNQLLDRLKDETDVCVSITSDKSGMGKATLAALVASHPSIQKLFHIVWLHLPCDLPTATTARDSKTHTNTTTTTAGGTVLVDDNISYEAYRDLLLRIVDQIAEQAPGDAALAQLTFPNLERRFEETALKRARERQQIERARLAMAQVLGKLKNPNVLLILENVTDDVQIPLFRFHDKQSVIVTTTEHNLGNIDWQVNLDPFEPEEAVDLFLQQTGLPTTHPVGATPELQALLGEECQHHPLVVRTVARWYRLKRVTAGPIQGLIEIIDELHLLSPLNSGSSSSPSSLSFQNSSRHFEIEHVDMDDDVVRCLFDVLSLIMGPTRVDGQGTSAIFVLCLAAMVVVFSSQRRAPLDVVLLLWEQVLLDEPMAADEIEAYQKKNGTSNKKKKRKSGAEVPKTTVTSPSDRNNSLLERRRYARLIAEGLIHMGVVEVYEAAGNLWIEPHHDMYDNFALAMAKELDLEQDTFEETCESWHKAFVTAYFEQRIQGYGAETGGTNSSDYAVDKLPTHIFQANILPMAETILTDDNFFNARVESMGWERAVDAHIRDCMRLQTMVESNTTSTSGSGAVALTISPVFEKTAAMIKDYTKGTSEEEKLEKKKCAASALYRMGFLLAEHGYFEAALTHFDSAQELTEQTQQLELKASICYCVGWVSLVSVDSKDALREVISSLKVMKQLGNKHVLYKEARQLHADTLLDRCEYKKALDYLVDLDTEMEKMEGEACDIEMGAVARKQGLALYAMGRLREAVEALEDSVSIKVESGEVSFGLAEAYTLLGDIHLELHAGTVATKHFENALATLAKLKCSKDHIKHLLTTGKLRFLKNDFSCFSALDAARKSINASPLYLLDQSAYDLRCIARIYEANGNVETSMAVLEESLQLTKNRQESLERAAALLDLGRVSLAANKIEKGQKCFEISLSIKITKLGQSLQVIEILNILGRVHTIKGAYEEAFKAYSDTKALLGSVAPNDSEKEAAVEFSVGEVYEAKGDTEQAMSYYQKSIDILRQTHASDDAGIARAFYQMGKVTKSMGEFDKAREYVSAALKIRTRGYDEDATAECHMLLGAIYQDHEDFEMAESCYRQALEIRKRVEDEEEIVASLLALGNLYRLQSKDNASYGFYEEGIKLIEEFDIAVIGDLRLALGHAKLFDNKYEEAVKTYRAALNALEASYGIENSKSAIARRSLGIALLFSGDADQAVQVLQEATTRPLEDKKDQVLSQVFLGDAFYASDQTERAVEMWRAAMDKYEDLFASESGPFAGFLDVMCKRRVNNDGIGDILIIRDEMEELKTELFFDEF